VSALELRVRKSAFSANCNFPCPANLPRSGRYIVFIAGWPVQGEDGTKLVLCRACAKEMQKVWDGALGPSEGEECSGTAPALAGVGVAS
jgi:hypothetical protein